MWNHNFDTIIVAQITSNIYGSLSIIRLECIEGTILNQQVIVTWRFKAILKAAKATFILQSNFVWVVHFKQNFNSSPITPVCQPMQWSMSYLRWLNIWISSMLNEQLHQVISARLSTFRINSIWHLVSIILYFREMLELLWTFLVFIIMSFMFLMSMLITLIRQFWKRYNGIHFLRIITSSTLNRLISIPFAFHFWNSLSFLSIFFKS